MLPFPLCNFFSVGEGDRPEDQTEGSPLISPTGNAGRRNTEGVSVAGVHLKPFSVGSFLGFFELYRDYLFSIVITTEKDCARVLVRKYLLNFIKMYFCVKRLPCVFSGRKKL